MLEHHPDPFRSVGRAAFEHAAKLAAAASGDRADAVCALMRLGALLGERNGHTGIHPLDRHAEPLRFFPLRLYEFDDGCFVVSAADPELVGTQVLEIGGVPIDSLAEQVEPLIPRDNEWTVRARRPSYLVSAEVLRGLGVDATFVLRPRAGRRREVVREPLAADVYTGALDADRRLPSRSGVRYLERRDEPAWVERLDAERVVLVGYNRPRGDTAPLARESAASAREQPAAAVVLDLRHNGGGDNTSYGPLLSELERRAETSRLVVLTSRITFSAAMQLVVDLEQRTNAVFVGEPTGGSPNQFGDALEVELPETGLLAKVATVSWETAGSADERMTRTPDLEVPLRAEDFFAGRDPVLDAALEL